jgi:hypothetical protein
MWEAADVEVGGREVPEYSRATVEVPQGEVRKAAAAHAITSGLRAGCPDPDVLHGRIPSAVKPTPVVFTGPLSDT